MSGAAPRIVVVDYGAGNLRSVVRALEHAGAHARITERPDELADSDAVVFPGAGAAASAMRGLRERGLIDPLRDVIRSGRPFLGVCLGLQVLMSWSDEDDGVACIGVIPGRVVRLPSTLKTPHMGWNQVDLRQPHRLFDGLPSGEDFYFVHSYVAVPDDPNAVVGTTSYGVTFASCVCIGNVVATQFHPEKSADAGLLLYANFTRWAAAEANVSRRGIGELV